MNVNACVCVRASVLQICCLSTCVSAYVYVPMYLHAPGCVYVWWYMCEYECLSVCVCVVYRQAEYSI